MLESNDSYTWVQWNIDTLTGGSSSSVSYIVRDIDSSTRSTRSLKRANINVSPFKGANVINAIAIIRANNANPPKAANTRNLVINGGIRKEIPTLNSGLLFLLILLLIVFVYKYKVISRP